MSERIAAMNERVRTMRERRLQRLISLLPRSYATGAGDSAIGALLDGFASALAELDEAAERTLRNRWVALAGGEPPWDEGLHPLERLAALVGMTREPWEDDPERFRRRLVRSAPALLRGPASVESTLTLAAAALDTELCRRLVRDGDTTVAWGMKSGTVSTCAGCHTPGRGRCQYENAPRNAGAIRVRLQLTDNPVTARTLQIRALRHNQSFVIRNASLAPDRPTVTIKAQRKVLYPALQSFRTGEIVLYAGGLEKDDVLVIRSERTEVAAPFTTMDRVGPAVEHEQLPKGRALLHRHLTSEVQDVTAFVYYLRGDVFERGRYARQDESTGAHFAEFRQLCRTPLVEHGEASWLYRSYTRKDVEGLADPEDESDSLRLVIAFLPADSPDRRRFEESEALRRVIADAPEWSTPDASAIAMDIELSWWTRPPATFRLTAPFMPDILGDRDRCDGALSLLRKTLRRTRAAGVRALVEVPELPLADEHAHSASLATVDMATRLEERAELAEMPLTLTASAVLDTREEHTPAERFSIRGVFEVTRFDRSHFGA